MRRCAAALVAGGILVSLAVSGCAALGALSPASASSASTSAATAASESVASPASSSGERVCGADASSSTAPRVSVAGLWARFATRMVALAAPVSPKNRLLVIDLKKRRVTLYVDGKATRTYPVAVGTAKDPSPVGEFRVVHKDRDWGGGFGARWMGLNVPWGIYGMHGTNKPYTVGTVASHGCFRMFNRDVIALFPEVPIGTPVHILGPEPKYWPRSLYRPGASGKDVVVLQFRLRSAGFDVPEAGGRYDAGTEASVRTAQAYFGLEETGNAAPDLQWLVGFRHEGEDDRR